VVVLGLASPALPGRAAAVNIKTAAMPDIDVQPAVLDFGRIGLGQSVLAVLTVRNTGDTQLTVTSISSSNGAFRIVVPAGAFNVAASGERLVTVSFNSILAGVQVGNLTIFSNDMDEASVSIQVRGEATTGPQPGSTPELKVDDGTAEGGALADGLMTVNCLTPPRYPATLRTIRIIFFGFVDLPNPTGQTITLVFFTGQSGSPPLNPQLTRIPVTIPALGSFIDFNIANGPAITSGDFCIGYQAPTPHNGVGFIFDVNSQAQNRSFVSTDGGSTFQGPVPPPQGGSSANQMVRAVVSLPPSDPDIDVQPTTLDFGNVNLGSSVQKTLTVRNTGGAALNITSASVSSGQFRIVGPTVPFMVAANSEQQVTMSLTPTLPGAQSGVLTIGSNDPDEAMVTVQLRGTGVTAPPAQTIELAIDDDSAEIGILASGLIVVNRLTPPKYPATLRSIRIRFFLFAGAPNPTAAAFKLIIITDPGGAGRPPAGAQIMRVDATVIGPGAYFDYPVSNGPTINSGDFYVGIEASIPHNGVGVAFDLNSLRQDRSFFSEDGGFAFGLFTPGGSASSANAFIRAIVALGGTTSVSTELMPTALSVERGFDHDLPMNRLTKSALNVKGTQGIIRLDDIEPSLLIVPINKNNR
jgi:hypothetical protein